MNFPGKSLIRRIFLKVFAHVNPGDIRIRHHWVPGAKVKLHAYRHKGYWYHGRNREHTTMERFAALVGKGDTVIEVGGHIGYISRFFCHLAGDEGKVFVFEPGENNLPYISANLDKVPAANLIRKAASNSNGTATFYLEDLTGQNNSMVKDYHVFVGNRDRAGSQAAQREVTVETVTLTDFIADNQLTPSFIKIDVEGAELQVMQGLQPYLETHRPALMVEITRDKAELFTMLQDKGYRLYDNKPRLITQPDKIHFNTFCLHPDHHAEVIANWFDKE